MTAPKHTPGPWLPEANADGIIRGIRAVPAGEVRKIINWGGISSPLSEQSQANARLMIAATDLLSALQGFLDYHSGHAPDPEITARVVDAEKAIAKATGGAR